MEKKWQFKSLLIHCQFTAVVRISWLAGRQHSQRPEPWCWASLLSRQDLGGMELTLTALLRDPPEHKPALPAPDPEVAESNLSCSGKRLIQVYNKRSVSLPAPWSATSRAPNPCATLRLPPVRARAESESGPCGMSKGLSQNLGTCALLRVSLSTPDQPCSHLT